MFFYDGQLCAAEGYSSIIDKLWQGVLWKFMKNHKKIVADSSAFISIALLSGINYNEYNKIKVLKGEIIYVSGTKRDYFIIAEI